MSENLLEDYVETMFSHIKDHVGTFRLGSRRGELDRILIEIGIEQAPWRLRVPRRKLDVTRKSELERD